MPVTNFAHPDPYSYQNGFGSYFEYDPEFPIYTELTDIEPRPLKELSQ